MILTTVAKRYASALYQEAKARDTLNDVARDMKHIGESISGSKELRTFLKSHTLSRDLKRETLIKVFDKGLDETTRRFMRLILDKRREDQLPGIAAAFEKKHKADQGIMDIEVFVVSRPDSAQSGKLKLALEKKTGNKVNLNYIEDLSLKGGMAVRIDDTVIDGTIKHKLQQLETTFKQNGL